MKNMKQARRVRRVGVKSWLRESGMASFSTSQAVPVRDGLIFYLSGRSRIPFVVPLPLQES